MPEAPIVALALLTQDELDRLGNAFAHVWSVDEVACFDELVQAIDRAEQSSQIARPTG